MANITVTTTSTSLYDLLDTTGRAQLAHSTVDGAYPLMIQNLSGGDIYMIVSAVQATVSETNGIKIAAGVMIPRVIGSPKNVYLIAAS